MTRGGSNHSVEYVAEDGTHVNWAESWFSRLAGAIRYPSPDQRAAPSTVRERMAWREDRAASRTGCNGVGSPAPSYGTP